MKVLVLEIADSVEITYDGKVSVFHGCKRYRVKRDIREVRHHKQITT